MAVENKPERKEWTRPELRSVVPAPRTRGGGGDASPDPDDVFYDAS